MQKTVRDEQADARAGFDAGTGKVVGGVGACDGTRGVRGSPPFRKGQFGFLSPPKLGVVRPDAILPFETVGQSAFQALKADVASSVPKMQRRAWQPLFRKASDASPGSVAATIVPIPGRDGRTVASRCRSGCAGASSDAASASGASASWAGCSSRRPRTSASCSLASSRRCATGRTCVSAATAEPGTEGARSRSRNISALMRRMPCRFNSLAQVLSRALRLVPEYRLQLTSCSSSTGNLPLAAHGVKRAVVATSWQAAMLAAL